MAMMRLLRWIISSMAEQLNKSRYCNGLLKMWQVQLAAETQLSDGSPLSGYNTAHKNHEGKAVSLLKKLPKPMLPDETRRDIQARESYHVLKIISEFVEAGEELRAIQPAVSIYGSARTPENHPDYEFTLRLARKLSDAGFPSFPAAGMTTYATACLTNMTLRGKKCWNLIDKS